MPNSNKNLVIIFAKPPVPGFAKTRLIPALGEEGAANFHASLVLQTLKNVLPSNEWQAQLWVANNDMPEFFNEIKQQYDIDICYQQGNDLGKRMLHALSLSLNIYDKVILIGTDCPGIDKVTIIKALQLLKLNDVVFNPAEDGGYVLIAARKIAPVVFQRISWGADCVMQQTIRNLKRSNLRWALGDRLWDVDTPQDLARLRREDYAFAKDLPPA